MVRARRVVIAVSIGSILAIACVEVIGIHDVPDGATADAGGGDGSSNDASDSTAWCDPIAPFGAPSKVQGVGGDGVLGLTISPDELTAYFCRTSFAVGSPQSLSYATRTSATGTFASEKLIMTDQKICMVSVTKDNLTLVWSHDDMPDSSNFPPQHLFRMTRGNVNLPFDISAGTPLTGLNDASEGAPFIRADGKELYYNEVSDGYLVTPHFASVDSGFELGASVAGLPPNAYHTIVSSDGLVAYFNASGIEMATRKTTSGAFESSNAVPLADAGHGTEYSAQLVSDDRCTLYYTTFDWNTANDGATIFSTSLYVVKKAP